MSRPEPALLFDLDGTLLLTAEANAKAYRQAFEEMGRLVDDNAVRLLAGQRIDGLVAALAPDFDETRISELRRRKAAAYRRFVSEIRAHPAVLEMLLTARQRGQKTALVTSASRHTVDFLLAHFHLTTAFDAIVTGDDVTHAKPHPEAYLLALARLGISTHSAIAIEDSDTGRRAATDAGLHVLCVSTPRPLTILMPMAGLGSRFTKTHPGEPKPLIRVNGRPMFEMALSSLDGVAQVHRRVVIVTRADLPDLDRLQTHLLATHPRPQLVLVPHITRGTAETALAARDAVDPNSGLVVLDCDLWLDSPALLAMIAESLVDPSSMDGAVTWFRSDHPRYSYLVADGNEVKRMAEKEVISHAAVAGAYYFSRARAFFHAADRCCAAGRSQGGELYISHVIQLMLSEGAVFKTAPLRRLRSFGTPEELLADDNAANVVAS